MSPAVIKTIIGTMASKEGRQLLSALGKDPSVDAMILKGIGMKNPTSQDVSDAKALFNSYNQAGDAAVQESIRKLRDIMMMDPKVRAVITGVRALSEGARAAGNMGVTHANRLAEALLSATRQGGDQQRSMYGLSELEKGAEAYGKNKLRKAEMLKHVTDAAANVIDKTIGDYTAQDMAVRSMSTAPYMQGTPGTLYEMINGMQSRAQRIII